MDTKFRLVILAAKRAKQLLKGAKKKIQMDAENPLTIALQEIKQGMIDPQALIAEETMDPFLGSQDSELDDVEEREPVEVSKEEEGSGNGADALDELLNIDKPKQEEDE